MKITFEFESNDNNANYTDRKYSIDENKAFSTKEMKCNEERGVFVLEGLTQCSVLIIH